MRVLTALYNCDEHLLPLELYDTSPSHQLKQICQQHMDEAYALYSNTGTVITSNYATDWPYYCVKLLFTNNSRHRKLANDVVIGQPVTILVAVCVRQKVHLEENRAKF